MQDWRPSAGIAVLRQRARMREAVRTFFHGRGLLEVETPVALAATVTDVQVESHALAGTPRRYLQTSPEYPMKRLLAAGSGDIFQLCPVFRAGESSRLHNPEFTMIEWYRLGLDLPAIMAETTQLATTVFQAAGREPGPVESLGYAQAFQRELGIDPLEARIEALVELARAHGLADSSIAAATRDDLLDFLIATRVGPALGRGGFACLHHFPASQAALAQLEPADPRTALRFELYAEGIELANGYVELADAREQRHRFEADLAERRRRGMAEPPVDERLLAAMESGLPACAGVAMGFDRVAMLALRASSIAEVMAFDWQRA
jgi:lysyl-tRNA synthetase class 2